VLQRVAVCCSVLQYVHKEHKSERDSTRARERVIRGGREGEIVNERDRVCERETDRQGGGGNEKERETERARGRVQERHSERNRACMRVHERERES